MIYKSFPISTQGKLCWEKLNCRNHDPQISPVAVLLRLHHSAALAIKEKPTSMIKYASAPDYRILDQTLMNGQAAPPPTYLPYFQ